MVVDSTIIKVIVGILFFLKEERIRFTKFSNPRRWAEEDVSESKLASVVNSVMERAQLLDDDLPTEWKNLASIASTGVEWIAKTVDQRSYQI